MKNRGRLIACTGCGLTIEQFENEQTCSTCAALDHSGWTGMCLACEEVAPEKHGSLYCDICIAIFDQTEHWYDPHAPSAELSAAKVCTSCFSAPPMHSRMTCRECYQITVWNNDKDEAKNPGTNYFGSESYDWGEGDDWGDSYGWGGRWSGSWDGGYKPPAVIPPVEEELEVFGRVS